MAIVVDNASIGTAVLDSAGTTIAFTTSAAVAAGGHIALEVVWYDGIGGAMTLSSVAGGSLTWTIDKQYKSAANGCNLAWVSAPAPAGLASGTTITATYSASVPAGRGIGGGSWTGVKTSSPVDGTPPAGANFSLTTAWATGSMTVQAGSLILGAAMQVTSNLTSTPTSPAIEMFDYTSGVGGMGATAAYRIEAVGAAYTVAGTWSSNGSGSTIGVAYLAAAAAAAAPDLTMAPRIPSY